MPLLQLERFVYPDNLLVESYQPGDDDQRWCVVHTRPRAEKALARKLAKLDVGFFLPQYRRQWRNQGRVFASYLPVFPAYVFLFGDPSVRVTALETNLVARVLPVPDQARLHDELMRIHQLLVSGMPLTPEQGLPQGTPVEITSGALKGLKGKVIRRGKGMRVFVEVSFLQSGVSVEVETWMLRVREPEEDTLARFEREAVLA